MKKLLVGFTIAVSLISGSIETTGRQKTKTSEKVYVCISRTAYAYHRTKSCHGLQRCTHEIQTQTKDDAVAGGYRPCKICY